MRVLLTTRQLIWGGGEALLLLLARAFAARGDSVTLAVPRAAALRRRTGELRVVDYLASVDVETVVANDFRSLWVRALRQPRARKVFIVHGWWQTSPLRNLVARALRTRVCAVSSAVRDAVVANGWLHRDEIRLLPLGPDHAVFRPPTREQRGAARAALGVPEDAFACVFVGRLQRVKRPGLFLESVRQAQAFAIVIAADEPAPTDDARARGLVESAVAEGWACKASSSAVRDGLWAADLFVSTSEFESLGVALMEAMACGLPVVTTARGGPSDFIANGSSGFVVRDSELATTIRALRSDDSSRRRVGRRGLAAVRTRTVDAVLGEMFR